MVTGLKAQSPGYLGMVTDLKEKGLSSVFLKNIFVNININLYNLFIDTLYLQV
jgi:hypothetical protein